MAGTVTQALIQISKDAWKLTFTCTGDASNGTIPNTDTVDGVGTGTLHINPTIHGKYLYEVIAYPTSGGTAPDAADVMIYDANGLDLLGSQDGGTTAYHGLNLIHATLTRKAVPDVHVPRGNEHFIHYPLITGALTLDVDNQDTVSADWTIELIFVRSPF